MSWNAPNAKAVYGFSPPFILRKTPERCFRNLINVTQMRLAMLFSPRFPGVAECRFFFV
jgi:hypothetical protein